MQRAGFFSTLLACRILAGRVRLLCLGRRAPFTCFSIGAEGLNFDKHMACAWLIGFELCHQTAVSA